MGVIFAASSLVACHDSRSTLCEASSSKAEMKKGNSGSKNTEYATREAKTNSAWTCEPDSYSTYVE